VRSRRATTLLLLVAALLVAALAVASPAGAAGPRVNVHGDSIAAQDATQLRNRLTPQYRLRLDATERAVIADKLPAIRVAGDNPNVDVVVLVLGAGDANSRHGDRRMRREIRQVLDALRDVPCVRWLSLKVGGVNGYYQGYVDRADDFNRILRAQVADYDNARVAPYREWAATHAGSFKADGLHHTARGKTRFAAFVQQVVDNPHCTP
jgi:hypothetical protein